MPDVFQTFNTSVQPATGVSAPTITQVVDASVWQVVKVTLVIPAGHAGLTGIQLWYGGNSAVPYDSGWFSGDDDIIPLELSDAFPAGVPWSVAMINNDVIAHSFQTRWEMNIIRNGGPSPAAAQIALQDIYALS